MITILHVIHDDKFFDSVIRQFDSFHCENIYVILGTRGSGEYRYIKRSDRVTAIVPGSQEYKRFIRAKYDIVFIHYLTGKERIVSDLIHRTKIVWLAWGGDFYSLIDYPLFQPMTREAIRLAEERKRSRSLANETLKKDTKYYVRKLLRGLMKYRLTKKKVLYPVFKKIDFCSTVVPQEYSYIQKLPKFRARQVFFTYAFDNSLTGHDLDIYGNSILVGNSRAWENNHMDIFQKLSSCEINDLDIICPFNYGTDIEDSTSVLDFGSKLFKERFKPMLEYLNFDEYRRKLQDCSVAVFNSNRQQALGNIILMLWQGASVYLSQVNPIYDYLKKLGICVFSIENDLNSKHIRERLSKSAAEENRRIIDSHYSEDVLKSKIMTLLETVLGIKPESLVR